MGNVEREIKTGTLHLKGKPSLFQPRLFETRKIYEKTWEAIFRRLGIQTGRAGTETTNSGLCGIRRDCIVSTTLWKFFFSKRHLRKPQAVYIFPCCSQWSSLLVVWGSLLQVDTGSTTCGRESLLVSFEETIWWFNVTGDFWVLGDFRMRKMT